MKPWSQTAPTADPVHRDMAANRPCLRCRTVFLSEGFGERICARCKASTVWRTALPPGGGQTRGRSG
jgi:hypothetical protein